MIRTQDGPDIAVTDRQTFKELWVNSIGVIGSCYRVDNESAKQLAEELTGEDYLHRFECDSLRESSYLDGSRDAMAFCEDKILIGLRDYVVGAETIDRSELTRRIDAILTMLKR